MNGFPGACRIHRAEIMRLRGDWPEAEKTALAACEEVHDFDRLITAGGYYEIGEIRRRRGDFAAAEEAFRTANELGRSPQPGLALLQLVQGKVESAVAGITRRLAEIDEPLERVRMLPALAEIALAAADLDTARSAAAELQEIVDSYKIGDRRAPAFDATVNLTLGQIELAEKTGTAQAVTSGARETSGRRSERRTRQPRRGCCSASPFGTRATSTPRRLELQAAQTTFERLGAKLDEERAKELLGRVDTRRTFLFTDIVGSTRLLENLGDERWSKLLAQHDMLVRTQIVESGGDVIKQTGDGFFASFDDPGAAIEAAVAIQRALQSEVFAPEVRIGAHAGTAFKTGASFSDYGGQSVHVAARIGAAAGAGEVLVSRETIDGIETSFRLSNPRAASLKGFEQPVEVVSVDWR